jgi:hypothetical protein
MNEAVENNLGMVNTLDRAILEETQRLASLTLEETGPENTREKRNNDAVEKEDNNSDNEKENSKKKRK